MKFWALWLTVCVTTCPVGALARPGDPAPSPVNRCAAWLASAHAWVNGDDPVVITARPDHGCRYERLSVGSFQHAGYDIATLDVHGIDFDPVRDFGPPMSLRLEARGIREARHGIGGAREWLLRQTTTPFDLVIDTTLDPGTQILTLHELSMTGGAIGRVELDGEMDGIDLTNRPGAGPAGLRALHGRLDSETFLTSFVLPFAVGLIPDADPGVYISQAKLVASAYVGDALPRAASPATVQAVLGFVADFPHPTHPFELTLSVPGDLITSDDIDRATEGRDGVAALMAKLRIVAVYDGAFAAGAKP